MGTNLLVSVARGERIGEPVWLTREQNVERCGSRPVGQRRFSGPLRSLSRMRGGSWISAATTLTCLGSSGTTCRKGSQ